jgi:phosphatidylglycerophosphate synthase
MAHVDRAYLFGPLIGLIGLAVVTLSVYAGLCAIGRTPVTRGAKHNDLLGPFWGRYAVWVLTPVERLLAGRLSPNQITALSLLASLGTGIAAALGHLITALWLFTASGVLDILDGRIARTMGRQTKSGALFDSVSDRWGELFAMAGYAWYLRDTPWMFAAMAASAGSVMVSYTRARGEGLGLDLHGGIMQRAERVILVCMGTFVGAWVGANPSTAYLSAYIVGGTMSILALTTIWTAVGRWVAAFRELAKQDAALLPVVDEARRGSSEEGKSPSPQPRPAPAVASPTAPFVPVPKALRESAEMGL